MSNTNWQGMPGVPYGMVMPPNMMKQPGQNMNPQVVQQMSHQNMMHQNAPRGNAFQDKDNLLLGGFEYNNDFDDGFEKHNLVESEGFPIEDYEEAPNFLSGSTSEQLHLTHSDLGFDPTDAHDDPSKKRLKLEQLGGFSTEDHQFINSSHGLPAYDPHANWQQRNMVQAPHPHQHPMSASSTNMMMQYTQGRPQQQTSPTLAVQQLQQHKKTNVDILQCFFKVYFQQDPSSSIPKDLVYVLYWRKMRPVVSRTQQSANGGNMAPSNNISSTNCLTKNAVTRKLLSMFKDLPAHIEDNKDIIKGLRLVTALEQIPQHLEKDVEQLRQYMGTSELFGFTQEELERDIPFDPPNVGGPGPTPPSVVPQRSSLLTRIQRLEQISIVLSGEITDLKKKAASHMMNEHVSLYQPLRNSM
ncbi:hypothetical protein PROFUN_07649 [Planoprotostelium fungivorum]|uniref:Uncharacterized protein n=1 Tax=Planoprotostelium fungivorum TaxID=1890364 RepID=A0A2P6NK57_9EUKA|nr:hypothetical protein PROFUN_07649 [Planoprotostelium fungivorum]